MIIIIIVFFAGRNYLSLFSMIVSKKELKTKNLFLPTIVGYCADAANSCFFFAVIPVWIQCIHGFSYLYMFLCYLSC